MEDEQRKSEEEERCKNVDLKSAALKRGKTKELSSKSAKQHRNLLKRVNVVLHMCEDTEPGPVTKGGYEGEEGNLLLTPPCISAGVEPPYIPSASWKNPSLKLQDMLKYRG